MKLTIKFEISKEALEHAAVDVEQMESQYASELMAEKIYKKFPPRQISNQEARDKGYVLYGSLTSQMYEQQIHVYTPEQIDNILAKLRVLKMSTRNIHVTRMIDNMLTILSL